MTYQFPNVNDVAVDVQESISKFTQYFTGMWLLIHV